MSLFKLNESKNCPFFFPPFFADGDQANMGPDVYDNINVIAGTLKLYLRLLPIPLVTFEAHPAVIKAARKLIILVFSHII